MEKDESRRLFREADELHKAGDYGGALEILDQLDREFPNDRRIMYPRAMCLAETGRAAEALELCDKLIEKHGYGPAAELKRRLQPRPQATRAARPPEFGDELSTEQLENIHIDNSGGTFSHVPRIPRERRSRMVLILGVVLVIALAAVAAGYYFFTKQTARENASPANSPVDEPATETAVAPRLQAPAAARVVPEIDLSGPPEIVHVDASQSEDGVTVNASIDFGVWTDCGSYDCFLEKFRACEPAAIRMQTMGTFTFEYRVLGEQDGACLLEMTVVEMPPYPKWNGKSMTCPCDNSKDFIAVTEEMSIEGIMNGTLECEGPLFGAMQETASQYQQ